MKERTDFEKLFLLATNANEAIERLIATVDGAYHQPWHKRLLGMMPSDAIAACNRGRQIQKFLNMWGATNSG